MPFTFKLSQRLARMRDLGSPGSAAVRIVRRAGARGWLVPLRRERRRLTSSPYALSAAPRAMRRVCSRAGWLWPTRRRAISINGGRQPVLERLS